MIFAKAEKVFDYFEQIAKIPRPSGKEDAVNKWLKQFAEGNGFEYIELGFEKGRASNILIKAAATKGFENSAGICLQAHTDMVCQKAANSKHNFDTDPIKLIYDGDWITADGTTLGADNGIGVAMAMAASVTDSHPALELLFTVDEEGGLGGASGLQAGVLDSKSLINLDSEDEGFIIGCAGGERFDISKDMKYLPADNRLKFFRIDISGLPGGHSGVDIHRNRVNAIKAAGELLENINKCTGVLLGSINGGTQTTAIARDVRIFLSVDKDFNDLEQVCRQFESRLLLSAGNKDVRITLQEMSNSEDTISKEDTKAVINLINALNCGAVSYCDNYPHIVETSSSLGTVMLDKSLGRFSLAGSERSCIDSRLDEVSVQNSKISRINGFNYTASGRYYAWQPDDSSALLKVCVDIYSNLVGSKPRVEIVHAGLECGVISKKYPNMDMISFGPLIENAHSPSERLSIRSTITTYELLLEIIGSL